MSFFGAILAGAPSFFSVSSLARVEQSSWASSRIFSMLAHRRERRDSRASSAARSSIRLCLYCPMHEEEEDTCMSYDEDDTSVYACSVPCMNGRRKHANAKCKQNVSNSLFIFWMYRRCDNAKEPICVWNVYRVCSLSIECL